MPTRIFLVRQAESAASCIWVRLESGQERANVLGVEQGGELEGIAGLRMKDARGVSASVCI